LRSIGAHGIDVAVSGLVGRQSLVAGILSLPVQKDDALHLFRGLVVEKVPVGLAGSAVVNGVEVILRGDQAVLVVHIEYFIKLVVHLIDGNTFAGNRGAGEGLGGNARLIQDISADADDKESNDCAENDFRLNSRTNQRLLCNFL